MMNKYLNLVFTLSITSYQALHADDTIQQEKRSSSSSVIELTEYEKILRDKILSFCGQDSQFDTANNERIL